MPTVKVKGVGYCVVRQAIHIDADKPTHIITGVFGLFDTIDEAEEFIFSSSDAPVRHTKTEHSYTDGEHYYTISTVRHPKHAREHHEHHGKYHIIIHDGDKKFYLRKGFFNEVLRGGVIKIGSSDITSSVSEAYATDDMELLKETVQQFKHAIDPQLIRGYSVDIISAK